MSKKSVFFVSLASFLILASCTEEKKTLVQTKTSGSAIDSATVVTSKTFGEAFNFIIISDWGRNGIKIQQDVANQMARTSDSIDAEFIATCGDNFQINGVASAQDPLWMLNFENVYKENSLHIDWYPVLGNHDYKGSTQAQIDYSGISRRWRMPDRYYSFAKQINDSVSARFIFIDTPQLINKYRNNPDEYPDAAKQNNGKELAWVKTILANSQEQWKIVFGHHPVYSASMKHGNTDEMITSVKPLLEKHNAQFYFCGHDHDFQHLHEKGGKVEYMVTGTGSGTRASSTNELSVFSKSEPGFTVISLKADSLNVCFVDTTGNIIYRFGRVYR